MLLRVLKTGRRRIYKFSWNAELRRCFSFLRLRNHYHKQLESIASSHTKQRTQQQWFTMAAHWPSDEGRKGRTKLILGAFAELRKLFSSCLSPHGITRLPLDEFSWNFMLEVLQKCIEKIQVLAKSDKNDGCFSWIVTTLFPSVTRVALVVKGKSVPMAGCICCYNYQGYQCGSLQ
jgi:hypothetical protein